MFNPREFIKKVEELIPLSDIDSHESDLYIRATKTSAKLIEQYEYNGIVETFRDNIEHKLWYDIPFILSDEWSNKHLAMHSEVLRFIQNFKRFDTGEVTQTFSNGYCYWFAFILHSRFSDSEIVYYEVGNHFACKIHDCIFDITGDITSKNLFFEPWEEYKTLNPKESNKIIKDCIEKTGI